MFISRSAVAPRQSITFLDHIGGFIMGVSSIHGSSFVLGPDGSPGNPGDDDGDGQADWLDPDVVKPDPEELGTGDDLRIAMVVDRGEFGLSGNATVEKYLGMASALGNRVSIDTQDEVDDFEIDLGDGARMICLAANGFVRDRSTRVPNVDTENERSLCRV